MNKKDKKVIVDFIQTYAGLEEEDNEEGYNELVRIQNRLCKELGISYKCKLVETSNE